MGDLHIPRRLVGASPFPRFRGSERRLPQSQGRGTVDGCDPEFLKRKLKIKTWAYRGITSDGLTQISHFPGNHLSGIRDA